MIIRPGIIKRIHVNQHNIRANQKDGGYRSVLTCKTSKGTVTGQTLRINGPSSLVYNPEKPLACGARVWIETKARVEIT